MATLTVTAAQVLPSSNTVLEMKVANEAITPGQVLYTVAATGKVALAQADGTSAEATATHISVGGASAANQYVVCAKLVSGTSITIGAGAAPTQGASFAVSGTAGGIAGSADIVTTGHFRQLIALGGASNVLHLITPHTVVALP
jgi:hypothetical protein